MKGLERKDCMYIMNFIDPTVVFQISFSLVFLIRAGSISIPIYSTNPGFIAAKLSRTVLASCPVPIPNSSIRIFSRGFSLQMSFLSHSVNVCITVLDTGIRSGHSWSRPEVQESIASRSVNLDSDISWGSLISLSRFASVAK